MPCKANRTLSERLIDTALGLVIALFVGSK